MITRGVLDHLAERHRSTASLIAENMQSLHRRLCSQGANYLEGVQRGRTW
jgi:hypothetical protein